jgi:LysM repeat protein
MDNQPTQPKQTTVAPTVTKPIEVAKETIAEAGKQTANVDVKKAETEATAMTDKKKEVKPMAKDPMNMFDYSDCKTHQVQDGESLFDIAEANHVALQQLRYFNHINKATLRIRPNQTIYIPNKPVPVPAGE